MISYEELAKAIAEERFEISVWQFDQMMRVFEDADPDFDRSGFLDIMRCGSMPLSIQLSTVALRVKLKYPVQGVKTCEKPFLYLVVNKK